MRRVIRSHFASAVLGGVIVAGGLLAFGVTGRRSTGPSLQQSPEALTAASSRPGLTPHEIYRRDAPAVVFIRARLVAQVDSPFAFHHPGGTGTSTGSGFVVDRRGDILTDYHVIAGAERAGGVSIEFEGGVTRDATVVGVDQRADLAVLRVDAPGLPGVGPLPLGDSTHVRVGDPMLAIGNPFGADRTLSSGIISALQHQIPTPDGASVDNVIQTDQPIDPGGAGGPLLDASGRVIGINSQLAGTAGDGTALAFATPIDTAMPMLARVRRQGSVRFAYLGLEGISVRGRHPAVKVTTAVPDGPAATAGLRHGDAIVKLDGESVSSIDQLQTMVNARDPGQTVALQVRRAGRVREVRVMLGSQEAQAPGG
jgi:S1-C subfamily serine protease